MKIKKGRVYKVISTTGNEVYVGSTFNTTRDRFKMHKKDYKVYKEGKCNKCSVYDIFDKYSVENCKIILIKEYEVCDRKHLEMYESLWILKLKSINKHLPFGEQNIKFLRKSYKRDHYENNKEEIKEKGKNYRENNIEKIKQKNKNYYEQNKQKARNYYEQNKQKITCECGLTLLKISLKRHTKTKIHSMKMEFLDFCKEDI